MPRNRSAQTDSSRPRGLTILVTAGPTHEPIDSVRYIANRSSGKMGIAIADAAAGPGHRITLLLGPARVEPTDSRVTARRFRSTPDLQALLGRLMPRTTILIMAAAVADYRPRIGPAARREGGKLRRRSSDLTLRLENTRAAGCRVHYRVLWTTAQLASCQKQGSVRAPLAALQ